MLGVSRDASVLEILDAYWRQVRLLDGEPDERLADLREAYETLTDPVRRARYDMSGEGALAAARAATSDLPPIRPLSEPAAEEARHSRNPLDRLTAGLPRGWRIAID